MVKATWNGAVIAESGETVVVEGNHYFPHGSVNEGHDAGNIRGHVAFWNGVSVGD
jgi:uncharacterized protein (DUF427 family)